MMICQWERGQQKSFTINVILTVTVKDLQNYLILYLCRNAFRPYTKSPRKAYTPTSIFPLGYLAQQYSNLSPCNTNGFSPFIDLTYST